MVFSKAEGMGEKGKAARAMFARSRLARGPSVPANSCRNEGRLGQFEPKKISSKATQPPSPSLPCSYGKLIFQGFWLLNLPVMNTLSLAVASKESSEVCN